MSCFNHRLIPKRNDLRRFRWLERCYQKRAKSRRDGETSSDNVRCQYEVIISWSSIELIRNKLKNSSRKKNRLWLTNSAVRSHQLVLIPSQYLHSFHYGWMLNQHDHHHLNYHHAYQSVDNIAHQVNTPANQNLLLLQNTNLWKLFK